MRKFNPKPKSPIDRALARIVDVSERLAAAQKAPNEPTPAPEPTEIPKEPESGWGPGEWGDDAWGE